MINIKYIEKIPFDVIINNIIPYTYNIQPKKLMNDVKNYFHNFSILEEIYETEYNYFILYYDLIEFCNDRIIIFLGNNKKLLNILQRHFLYKNYSEYTLNYYILNKFTIPNGEQREYNSSDPWRAWILPSRRSSSISTNPVSGDAGYSRTDRFCLSRSLRRTPEQIFIESSVTNSSITDQDILESTESIWSLSQALEDPKNLLYSVSTSGIYTSPPEIRCKKKIRFLWGLLRPIERIKFMKKYIISDFI